MYKKLVLIYLLFIASFVSASEIAVSIKPFYSLVKMIVGDANTVSLLVKSSSPHDAHLLPSHIKLLQDAKLVIYVDDKFENFLTKAIKNLDTNTEVLQLSNTPHLRLTNKSKNQIKYSTHDEHGPDVRHDGHKSHKHDDKHRHDEHHNEHRDKHEHNHYAGHDLHLWLGIENTRKIIQHISHTLVHMFPENKHTYQSNTQDVLATLAKTNNNIKKTLKRLEDKPFIVSHNAYGYFVDSYNLNQLAAITIEPSHKPSIGEVKYLRNKIKESGVRCVFGEVYFNNDIIETIIHDSGVKTIELDPLGKKLSDYNYFKLLENLAQNFKTCLSE